MTHPIASTLLCLLLLSLWPAAASAQQSVRPCGERRVGSRTVDGVEVMIFRIRPSRGTSCEFGLTVEHNLAIRELSVVKRPSKGKLTTATRNRIVYAAAKDGGDDLFVLSFRVESIRGHGWINFAVQVQSR